MNELDLNIAWIDIETTGLNEINGAILEVAYIITDKDLNTLEEYNYVINPGIWPRMDSEVRLMHEKSGLFSEVESSRLTMKEALYLWHDALIPYLTNGVIACGGSGVSHFDRRWLNWKMPKIEKLFPYWSYDVGCIRRACTLFDYHSMFTVDRYNTHRALTDAKDALDEFKFYKSLIKGCMQ